MGAPVEQKTTTPQIGVAGPELPEDDKIIAQADEEPKAPADIETSTEEKKGEEISPPREIFIDFTNISIIEYIRFVSRIANKNFIFDEPDLQFNVTIVSEEPTTVENIMTALMQELRIHGLTMIEQGNNIIIHKNMEVNSISAVSIDEVPPADPRKNEIITQVFRLNTLDPTQAAAIILPLTSKTAEVTASDKTRHLIVTDIITNVNQISKLIKGLDAPSSGLVIGQYVVRNSFIDTLISLTQQIMAPIAKDQPLTFVPHPAAQSVFVIATPFLVERALSVLQHLDRREGETKIFNLEDLKFEPITPPVAPPVTAPEGPPEAVPPEEPVTPTPRRPAPTGRWEIDPEGRWIFRPGIAPEDLRPGELPQGRWILDPQGNWHFVPEGTRAPFRERTPEIPVEETPKGSWSVDPEGKYVFELTPGEQISPEWLRREIPSDEDLPIGHIERTKFYLHKLQFRNGEEVVDALRSIASSLQETGVANEDLLMTINSVEWIEPTNTLIVTGTANAIDKIRELIQEIDTPLRQVFIEMLILETDIDDSLAFGVTWGTRSGGGSTSTAQSFIGAASPLSGALFGPENGLARPDARTLGQSIGFNLGVIGQRLTHNGTQFATLGALVRLVHGQGKTKIIMNPKVITEENKTAEFFVGINTPFQNESISNDEGSIITTNVEFRDVGTTLTVTPHIGNNDVINLEIQLENSSVGEEQAAGEGEQIGQISTTPTTRINRTNTTVNVPDGFFVIISGMIQDELTIQKSQVPCLGGIPILGGAFKQKTRTDQKRNLMVFIRPKIVDTDEEYNDLTKQQQDIFEQKTQIKADWKHHMDQALKYLNIRPQCDPCEECD